MGESSGVEIWERAGEGVMEVTSERERGLVGVVERGGEAYFRGTWGWFKNKLERVIGDGKMTSFWEDSWVDESESLKSRFPRLYHMSRGRETRVSEMGVWEEGCWNWR